MLCPHKLACVSRVDSINDHSDTVSFSNGFVSKMMTVCPIDCIKINRVVLFIMTWQAALSFVDSGREDFTIFYMLVSGVTANVKRHLIKCTDDFVTLSVVM